MEQFTRKPSAAMVFGANFSEDVTLAGGLRVRFRAVTPADKQKLADGFARLSAESRNRRFFTTKTALTGAELAYFTEPDGIDHVAIGAVEIVASGEEGDGLGIGHLLRLTEDPEVAEIALVVTDARHGIGIGRRLLERLIAAASERDIRRIRCHLLADNERMRRLIRRVLGDAAFTREDGVMTGEFPVPATRDPKQVSQDVYIAPLFHLLRLLAAGSMMSVRFGFANVRYGLIWMTPRTGASEWASKDEHNGED